MKKITILLIAFCFSSMLFASSPVETSSAQIRAQVSKLLKDAPFIIYGEINAQIDFIITKNGEIIVTNVESNNPQVENYVKQRLNYKKVSTERITSTRFFVMPLKIIEK